MMSRSREFDETHRLVVLGSQRVGKTAIVQRLLYQTFPTRYIPTVEDVHHKEIKIPSNVPGEYATIILDVFDMAGHHEFPAMRRLSLSTASAFIIVFSIDDTDSLDEAKTIWKEIQAEREDHSDIPCAVVMNKIDLPESEKKFDRTSLIGWSMDWDTNSAVLEVSAKEDINIRSIFLDLMKQVKKDSKLKAMVNERISSSTSEHGDVDEVNEINDTHKLASKTTTTTTSKPPSKRFTYSLKVKHTYDGNGLRKDMKKLTVSSKNDSNKNTLNVPSDDGEHSKGGGFLSRSKSLIRRGSSKKKKQLQNTSEQCQCPVS